MAKPGVFFLSTSLNIGGTENFLVTLIENLRDKYDFSVGYIKEKGYWGNYLSEKGFNVVHLPGPIEIYGYLRKNRFLILHTFLYRANILGRILGRLAGVPVVVSSQRGIDAWKNWAHILADKFSSYFCDLILANSMTAKETLVYRENISPAKIRIFYNGINPVVFKTDRPKEEIKKELGIDALSPVILCVSRLHREKGTDFLPDIARNVNKGVFVIAGEGPDGRSIENKIAEFNMKNRFLMTGWNRNVPELMAAADLFILPSREESFPQVILEAMSQGLAVVASDVGGVKELVVDGETGILIPPGRVTQFSMKINYLLDNPDKAKNMGESGRKRSRLFSQSKMIEQVNAVYGELINKISGKGRTYVRAN